MLNEGVLPKVQVIVKPRQKMVEIRDNGRGRPLKASFSTSLCMARTLTGGRAGRGKFGTGKAAAFGIGKLLRVDTQRNRARNVVELHRDAVEASSGKDIELKWIVRNEPTEFPNGTIVTIEEIFLPKLKTYPLIEYIERHLQIYRARMPEVAVNEHVCQYREPNIAEVHTFRPSAAQAEVISNVELTIKVSTSPLPSLEQGVAITAGLGNLVAIETGGIETKELGNYLFGDIERPRTRGHRDPNRTLRYHTLPTAESPAPGGPRATAIHWFKT